MVNKRTRGEKVAEAIRVAAFSGQMPAPYGMMPQNVNVAPQGTVPPVQSPKPATKTTQQTTPPSAAMDPSTAEGRGKPYGLSPMVMRMIMDPANGFVSRLQHPGDPSQLTRGEAMQGIEHLVSIGQMQRDHANMHLTTLQSEGAKHDHHMTGGGYGNLSTTGTQEQPTVLGKLLTQPEATYEAQMLAKNLAYQRKMNPSAMQAVARALMIEAQKIAPSS